MRVQLLDPRAPSWTAELDRIGMALRPGQNSTLFPYHFLQVTLPRIGGKIGWVFRDTRAVGVAFLFPRQRDRGGQHVFTLRYHALAGEPAPDAVELAEAATAAVDGRQIVVYDVGAEQYYSATHQEIAGVDIGRPDAVEAAAVPDLHHRIWGSPPEFLYPADLHSVDFAAGTSLVARVSQEGRPACVGFLIGFYKFSGSPLPADWQDVYGGDYRLESQIMGVLPEYRGLRIANLLKKVQAEQAWREGIGIVNWTADPLLYANAALNFGLLGAVAFDFAPDLYPFRNDLNRVSASRFGLTWLIGSERVRTAPMVGSRAAVLDLALHPELPRVNDGWRALHLNADQHMIAIEIPPNWTQLQNADVPEALRWRAATDSLLAHYIGPEEGRYCVTGVGVDRERRFLLAERSSRALWARLGRQ